MVFISVVVTAYNRQEFLEDCLSSIESQTLDRDEYEVILISNFEYDKLKSRNFNSRHFVMEGSVGEYVSKGIKESMGEIVSFLDDDDIFQNQKLAEIKAAFEKNIDYHKHSVFPFRRLEDLHTAIDLGNRRLRVIKERNFYHPDIYAYNRTSITIRKQYVLKYLDQLSHLTTSEDWFFFFAFITENVNGVYDPATLSFYRKHRSTSSKIVDKNDERKNSYVEYIKRLIEAFLYMQKVFDHPRVERIISYQTSIFKARLFLLTSGQEGNFGNADLKNLLQASIKNYNEFLLTKFLFLRGLLVLHMPKLSDAFERMYVWFSKGINSL